MSLPEFKLLRPRMLEEAVELLGKHSGDVKIVAGGTDLIPSMRQKLFTPAYVLDIRSIRELRGIRETAQGTEIGALTTLTEVEHSPLIRQKFPVLHEAAAAVASPILRNMGTMGGNVCLDTRCLWYNQSLTWRKSCGFCIKKDGNICHVAPGGEFCWAAFSGDTPPALMTLGADLELAGPKGTRRLPLADFYSGEGDAHLKLEKDELVARILLPKAAAGWLGAYRKLRIRGSIDYPLAGVAVALKRSNGHIEAARVAMTAVNPAPVLIEEAGELLAGKPLTAELAEQAGELAARASRPLTTHVLTPEYRREMVRVFAKRALLAAGEPGNGPVH